MSLSTEHIRVIYAQETCNNRNILLQGSGTEMAIHSMSTAQELVEVLESDMDGNREANGRPDGIPSTNPALELEHILRIDAEIGDFCFVGG